MQAVLAFYDAGFNRRDADAAVHFLGAHYTQHNPNTADGVDGFRGFVAMQRQRAPESYSKIKRVFVDGDYVILHVHRVPEPGMRGSAIIDIFRLEDGKIVEHWDVTQPIPGQTTNGNPMV